MKISKEIVKDTISLCEVMANGRSNGTINQLTYSEKFKPFLTQFKEKFGESPNLFLQNELKLFYDAHLGNVNSKIDYKSFGFWGRAVYNYTWACIYYDFDKEAIPASYSPQLYIVVNKYGIKFGFCYGNYVDDTNDLVKSALEGKKFFLLKKCFEDDRELKFFNSAKEEVTASPEKLFGDDEKVVFKSDNELISNWTSRSLLIKEFSKDNIPDNIAEIIQATFLNLKDFFLSILPTNNLKPEIHLGGERNLSPFKLSEAVPQIKSAGLQISDLLITRFISSLLTKPFVILTGLSGSGKTKLAQVFAKWICEDSSQYKIIPVGADWTNRESLFGYPNALESEKYILPDNGTLSLILEAKREENQSKPYFLILDEMNLSHVERYFADFLSTMESGESIPLHNGEVDWDGVPPSIKLPKNLFVIGTVNIDETTYMFSPKVLDRANVIEFRVTKEEMSKYLDSPTKLDLNSLTAGGATMAASFVEIASDSSLTPKSKKELNEELLKFFIELKKSGAEFGYRSASEISRFAAVVNKLEPDWELPQIVDAAIMQKLLPKVHGSRKKLEPVLKKLAELCLNDTSCFSDYIKDGSESIQLEKIKYPISMEKIGRMYRALLENSFTSYAEA